MPCVNKIETYLSRLTEGTLIKTGSVSPSGRREKIYKTHKPNGIHNPLLNAKIMLDVNETNLLSQQVVDLFIYTNKQAPKMGFRYNSRRIFAALTMEFINKLI